MARSNSKSAGCLTLVVILLVVGGCMRLFGYETESEKAAAAAEAIRAKGLPDLRGKTLAEAENAIRAMDISFDDEGIGSFDSCDDKTDCIVFRMSLKPGTVVGRYGKVTVTWTTSEERAWYGKWKKMPKVIGWSEEKAERFFTPVETAVESESRESKRVAYGKDVVIATSPKAGAPLRLGQKIRVVIGYNLDDPNSSTGTGNGNTDVDVDLGNGGGGESRFCSRRWWC
ncbi:PASTA domain-containing protein [Planomonospora venezuelensis]|uniref:Beta-lactam-binding protein with PASTA domain n=1 Tax=Planomonospora venezuelensis TaxID=1999 RepID=A0A841D988_PLAVE|nr:PASTA domain-containing protein [Planomonospora venezuelensis]MBB5965054.1 beta-lactam-binding protein with PASTA domain [Planomonospora venezuelensis]GIN05029.1 hypothetical protein Pve01_66870 [Planomonospora venezuelensis]